MTKCSECGDDNLTMAVLFDEEWVCVKCHSVLDKIRDDKYYANLAKGLSNALKNNYMRKK